MWRLSLRFLALCCAAWCVAQARTGLRSAVGSAAGGEQAATGETVETAFVRESLLAGLRSAGRGPSAQRLEAIEASLRSMYQALPKAPEHAGAAEGAAEGGLGGAVVRYALHRFFEERYGWRLKGLGEGRAVRSAAAPAILQKDLAPALIISLVEDGLQGRGVNLHELAVLAATIQDLVHAENNERLLASYMSHGISTETDDERMLELVQNTYLMLLFHNVANFTSLHGSAVQHALEQFQQKNSRWSELKEWMIDAGRDLGNKIRDKTNVFVNKKQDFAWNERLAEQVVQQFGRYEEISCRLMKDALLELEDVPGNGRVSLHRLYTATPLSGWTFAEPREFLRLQAALDETDPENPAVVIPNYVYLKTNCLNPSPLYGICCLDQCMPLLARVEAEVAAPTATPQRLAQIAAGISSETVAAPRNLSQLLKTRLEEIGVHHGGKVPLHGRLFAQWMHHAFPAECPFPHAPGRAPEHMTIGEWIAEDVQDASRAQVDLRQYVLNASPGDPSGGPRAAAAGAAGFGPAGLPWTPEEELMAAALEETPPRAELGGNIFFSRLMRGLVFASAALGAVVSLRQKFLSALAVGVPLPLRGGGVDKRLRC